VLQPAANSPITASASVLLIITGFMANPFMWLKTNAHGIESIRLASVGARYGW
jgi:hypothetical protein